MSNVCYWKLLKYLQIGATKQTCIWLISPIRKFFIDKIIDKLVIFSYLFIALKWILSTMFSLHWIIFSYCIFIISFSWTISYLDCISRCEFLYRNKWHGHYQIFAKIYDAIIVYIRIFIPSSGFYIRNFTYKFDDHWEWGIAVFLVAFRMFLCCSVCIFVPINLARSDQVKNFLYV